MLNGVAAAAAAAGWACHSMRPDVMMFGGRRHACSACKAVISLKRVTYFFPILMHFIFVGRYTLNEWEIKLDISYFIIRNVCFFL